MQFYLSVVINQQLPMKNLCYKNVEKYGIEFVLFVLYYIRKSFINRYLLTKSMNFRYGLSITYFIIIGDQLDRCNNLSLFLIKFD